MNETALNFWWLIGGLVMAVAALASRRLEIGAVVRALLAWGVIAGVAWAVIAHRPQVETLVQSVAERVGIGDQSAEGDTVRITMAADGHFWARARINGHPRRLLIDSGATVTALSAETARATDIAVETAGFPTLIETANGTVAAQRATAARVSVGALEMRDLGVVVSPAFGDIDVLGMNFLSRLGSWRVEGRTLMLEPKRKVRDTGVKLT